MPVIDSSYGIGPVFPSQIAHKGVKKAGDSARFETRRETQAISSSITQTNRDQLSYDRIRSDRLAEYRRQENATDQQRVTDEIITRRSEGQTEEADQRDTAAALDRLRDLASRNGAATPPIALTATQTRPPLIQESDRLSDEFAFDIQSQYFVARQRSGELSVEPEIRAGRAVGGVIGTFSPIRLDLPTDLLLRRENERSIAFADKTAEAYRQFETEENQKIDQENSIKRTENEAETKQADAYQAIEVSANTLSERDAAPPQLPVVSGQGPDFSDQTPAHRDPLNSLGQLINVAA